MTMPETVIVKNLDESNKFENNSDAETPVEAKEFANDKDAMVKRVKKFPKCRMISRSILGALGTMTNEHSKRVNEFVFRATT